MMKGIIYYGFSISYDFVLSLYSNISKTLRYPPILLLL